MANIEEMYYLFDHVRVVHCIQSIQQHPVFQIYSQVLTSGLRHPASVVAVATTEVQIKKRLYI